MNRRALSLLAGSAAALFLAAPALAGQHGGGVNWTGSHGGVNWDGGHPYSGVDYKGNSTPTTTERYPRRTPYLSPRADPAKPTPTDREARNGSKKRSGSPYGGR